MICGTCAGILGGGRFCSLPTQCPRGDCPYGRKGEVMKPDPRTGLFSERDMRQAGNPLPALAAVVAASWLLFGCAGGPKIDVPLPDVTINPPAALLQPPESLRPAFWTKADTAPSEDALPAVSEAATAPKAPAATAAAPKAVPPRPAPALTKPQPVSPKAAPVVLIPPAPAVSAPESGKAPMPSAPPK